MGLEERVIEEKRGAVKRKDWVYSLVNYFLRGTFFIMGYKITVEGLDLIPEEGPVLIVFNHRSKMDPLMVMYAVRRPINSIGKKEIFGIPGWTWLINACGAYPIDRFNKDVGMNRRALIYSKDLLELDEIVSLAPGATRAPKIGKIRPKMLMALERRVSCPIIACGIYYSNPAGLLPNQGSSIRLRFSEYDIWEDDKLKSEEAVAEELGQLLSKLSGYPYDPSYDALREKYFELME